MKTKSIILLVACTVMMLSFGFVSVKPKDKNATVKVETKSPDQEANIGLLSEDKL